MKTAKNKTHISQGKNAVQELIKPMDIKNEDQFFEATSLCLEFGSGIECKGVNKAIDEDSDLLF
jgi:hypothetical protein